MAFALFVFGPAGTGKSTFVRNLYEHGQLTDRNFTRVNLDPAQNTNYEIDITEYITVNDVMQELDYGPNGGLVYALREFIDNIEEVEELQDLTTTDSYLIIDCPGQIELFTHSDEMLDIVKYFQRHFKCSIVYLIEAQFIMDTSKYLSGCMTAMLSMMRFNLPHLNVITKLDLLSDKDQIIEDEFSENNMYLYPDSRLLSYLKDNNVKYKIFSEKILQLLEDNNLITFLGLNWDKDGMIDDILYQIDSSLEYHEDAETKIGFKD